MCKACAEPRKIVSYKVRQKLGVNLPFVQPCLQPMIVYNKIEMCIHLTIFGCLVFVSIELLVEDALGKQHNPVISIEPVYIEASFENPYVPPNLSPETLRSFQTHRQYKNSSTPLHGEVGSRESLFDSSIEVHFEDMLQDEITEEMKRVKGIDFNFQSVKKILVEEINYSRFSVVVSEQTCLTLLNFTYGLMLGILLFFNSQVTTLQGTFEEGKQARLADHNIVSAVEIAGIQSATLPLLKGKKVFLPKCHDEVRCNGVKVTTFPAGPVYI